MVLLRIGLYLLINHGGPPAIDLEHPIYIKADHHKIVLIQNLQEGIKNGN